tara:strand:- start:5208 stop:5453 length:246 start_codon:yes stop_codon:yes gene_type:complete
MKKATIEDIKGSKVIEAMDSNRAYSMTPEGKVFNRFSKKFITIQRHKETKKRYASIVIRRPNRSFKIYIDKWKAELFPTKD